MHYNIYASINFLSRERGMPKTPKDVSFSYIAMKGTRAS